MKPKSSREIADAKFEQLRETETELSRRRRDVRNDWNYLEPAKPGRYVVTTSGGAIRTAVYDGDADEWKRCVRAHLPNLKAAARLCRS